MDGALPISWLDQHTLNTTGETLVQKKAFPSLKQGFLPAFSWAIGESKYFPSTIQVFCNQNAGEILV